MRVFMRLSVVMWVAVSLIAGYSSAAPEAEPQKTKLDTNREVVRTYARIYLEQKDFIKAENTLVEYLAQEGADGNLWNLLGLTQLEQKKHGQACYAFQKAVNTFTKAEDQIYAMYNFADCLNRGGRSAEARQVLLKLKEKENGLSDSATGAIQMMDIGLVQTGTPLPPYRRHGRGQWRVSAAMGAGFDSNVLLVEEAVATSTSVADRGSFFTTPAFQLGYLGRLFEKNFDTRYLGSYTHYLSSNAATFNTFFNRMDFMLNSGEHRYGLFSDVIFMNRNPFQLYNYDVGFTWMQVRVFDDQRALILETPVRYQRFMLDEELSSADNDRTGVNAQGRMSYRVMTSDLESWNLSAQAEIQYSTGKNFRFAGLRVPFLWTVKLPLIWDSLGLLSNVGAQVDGLWYFSNDFDRKDLFARGLFGVQKRWSETWSAQLDFSYQRNFSTVDSAQFTKGVTTFAINKEL